MIKLSLTVLLLIIGIPVSAQTRVIVPFPPGGGADIVARVLFRDITEKSGRQFVIENISGASGNIGRLRSIRENTLVVTPNSLLLSAYIEKLNFVPLEEFKAVVGVGDYPYVISAHPSFPSLNIKEFPRLAKNYGVLNISSGGAAGGSHLIINQLVKLIKFPVEFIPHKGTMDAAMSTMSGSVPLLISAIQGTSELVRSGKLRAIAVTTAQRDINLKEVPTIQEMINKPFNYPGWYGVFAPRRYDEQLANEISTNALIALQSPKIRQVMHELSINIQNWPPEKFETFLRIDDKQWATAARGTIK